jgi:hypothetical protein
MPMTVAQIKRNRFRVRRWYYAHKEAAKKRIHLWQKANPKKVAAYRKQNREVILAGQRKCYRRRRGHYLAMAKVWATANPERRKKISREWARKDRFRKLGFSIAMFTQRLRKQKRKCLICRCRFSKRQRPCVDHCHKTNRVRGLLCNLCNVGLGSFRDSPIFLRRAARYLGRPK